MNILAYKVSTERGQAQIEARNASRMLRHVPRLRLRHGARQCRPHQRAMWSVRTRLKAAPDKTYPFPHPYQAQPTGSSPRARGLRHASAVVGDGELDRVAEAQVDPDVLGLGMADDVAQRLLGDAVHRQLGRRSQPDLIPAHPQGDGQSTATVHLGDEVPQGGDEPEVVEHRWP